MKNLFRAPLAALLLLALPASSLAGDKPLIRDSSGQVKPLPAANTLQVQAGVEFGSGTDTTVTRTAPGDIAVEGSLVYRAGGGTDVPVADGGTGASTESGARTNLGVAIGSDVQAYDADLAIFAGITPSANVQTLLGAANFSAFRSSLGVALGSDVQAYDVDLTTYGGITPSANVQTLLGAASYSAFRSSLGVALGSDVQAYDADLAALGGLTSAADKCLYFTGSGTAGVFTCGSTGRALVTQGYQLESFCVAASDETTAITTGTAKVTWRMPYAFTVTDVRASVNTAPTGSTILIDINEGGTTIISTKLMIDASELTSTTAATPAVISDSALADDAAMTADFDQVGSTIAGKGVKLCLIGHQ